MTSGVNLEADRAYLEENLDRPAGAFPPTSFLTKHYPLGKGLSSYANTVPMQTYLQQDQQDEACFVHAIVRLKRARARSP